jgi:hypothetical protein
MIVILILEKIVKIRKRGFTRGDLHSVVLLHYKTPFILEKTAPIPSKFGGAGRPPLYLPGKGMQ